MKHSSFFFFFPSSFGAWCGGRLFSPGRFSASFPPLPRAGPPVHLLASPLCLRVRVQWPDRVFPCPSVLEGGDCSSLILFRPNLETPVTKHFMRHISKGPALTPTCSCPASSRCVSFGVSYRLSSVIRLPGRSGRGAEVCRLTWPCFVFPPARPCVVEGVEGRTPRLAGQPQLDSCARLPGRGLTCAVPRAFQQQGGRHPGSGLRAATLALTTPRDPSAFSAAVAPRPGGHWRRPCPLLCRNVCPRLSQPRPSGALLRTLCGGF